MGIRRSDIVACFLGLSVGPSLYIIERATQELDGPLAQEESIRTLVSGRLDYTTINSLVKKGTMGDGICYEINLGNLNIKREEPTQILVVPGKYFEADTYSINNPNTDKALAKLFLHPEVRAIGEKIVCFNRNEVFGSFFYELAVGRSIMEIKEMSNEVN